MSRKLLFTVIILCVSAFVLIQAKAAVPQSPSEVYVDGNQLMVKRPLMIDYEPYLIKGTTWQPSTRVPGVGPNPLNTTQTIDYGFFFDWYNRNPVGSEALNYWMKNQVLEHYQEDIVLMKDMNINTVRVYNDFYDEFSDNVDDYIQVLDEFYNNDIMVIMTVAISRDDFEGKRLYVYNDQNHPLSHYTPSGWVGDIGELSLADDTTSPEPHSGEHCLEITYTAGGSQNWAGIFWQFPPNNWGAEPGLDIARFVKVVFWARGDSGGEKISGIKVGGISGDTATVDYSPTPIVLTSEWQQYSIDLDGYDLSDIRSGFYILFTEADISGPQTIYLDDIYYVSEEKRYEQVVNSFKDHPAILMWSIGNEWNLNNFYGYGSFDDAAAAVNQAALDIKAIDSNHPVSSCLGDVFTEPSCDPADPCCNLNLWTVGNCVTSCPNVDVWGMNVYRGDSFTDLFDQWELVTTKPLYLSEFGTDSYGTNSFTLSGCYHAVDCSGAQAQSTQTTYALGLWSEIEENLSFYNSEKICLGGLLHEFNDELWKVGNYHAGMGGLVGPGDTSYDEYNSQGITFGGHPDLVANEEHFGVVDADRNPKEIFNELKQYYAGLGFAAPSGLTAGLDLTTTPHQIYLEWIDNSDGEDGFRIERKLDSPGSEFAEINTVGADETTYEDRNSGLVPRATYIYRVCAYKGDINSAYTVSAPVTFCFIATTAYGSAMHDEIEALRNFRDQYLLTNALGRRFVELYYKYSPPAARFISGRPRLRAVVRFLLKPLVWMSEKITK